MHIYYIANFAIIAFYPLSRIFRMINFYAIDSPDEVGNTRENSIFYTIIAFIVVKWYRSYSRAQFLSDMFFSVKLSLIVSYLFANPRIAFGYTFACFIVWLLFKEPGYEGKTNFIRIETLDEYENILGVHFKESENDVIEELNERFKNKQKLAQKAKNTINYKQTEMVFVEFYVDWAPTCNHTKEIWAAFSNQYQTSKIKFISVNLQDIPKLAEYYRINTSSVSRQLPTVILFEDGEEARRFPPIDPVTRKIPKVLKYGKKELIAYFDLDKRYLATRDL